MNNFTPTRILTLVLLLGVLASGLGIKLYFDEQGRQGQEILTNMISATSDSELEIATFAAGCFWCTEAVFQETPGVIEVISGYAGGQEVNPTYEDVYTNSTGHRESIQVSYDSEQIGYEEILEIFWRSIDPTDSGGQFVDRGFSYTTAVFYHNEEQKQSSEESLIELELLPEFREGIATKILPYTTFYKAEEYHQDFYIKSSERYKQYEGASGRAEFKRLVWERIKLISQ